MSQMQQLANYVQSATAVHSKLRGDPLAVEEILKLEDHFGSRSFCHKMAALQALTKPATAQMRLWVLRASSDQIFWD